MCIERFADYRNALFSAFMPIISSSVFDDTGKPYDVSRILTPDYRFNHEAYNRYSKVYLPITYALSYAVQFAGLSALLTHTICWHGQEIWQQSQQSFAHNHGNAKSEYQPVSQGAQHLSNDTPEINGRISSSTIKSGIRASMNGEDVHNRLMRRYEDAPMSWYLATFVVMLGIGIFVVEY